MGAATLRDRHRGGRRAGGASNAAWGMRHYGVSPSGAAMDHSENPSAGVSAVSPGSPGRYIIGYEFYR